MSLGTEYGWDLGQVDTSYSFICEISVDEVYRILQQFRDFGKLLFPIIFILTFSILYHRKLSQEMAFLSQTIWNFFVPLFQLSSLKGCWHYASYGMTRLTSARKKLCH